ncbi:unnamed protein product (macronuclear) [Paramecium tetraurelia]|uniref:Phosphodiesterase n=1 Tax=Paramecium tetraurelia TaxID=5888 RepID=A0CZ03_PARTE|nr:uncharacterized protein GSPATT00011621001 [Paramecium tetraurelia]CAK76020.1 unnamed protein product [Paramecium tetraurelia]|eukprot:XP_001443417.1 hypothetical protein (macronuclear) [Paramecium tetraurelia strain d4-2]
MKYLRFLMLLNFDNINLHYYQQFRYLLYQKREENYKEIQYYGNQFEGFQSFSYIRFNLLITKDYSQQQLILLIVITYKQLQFNMLASRSDSQLRSLENPDKQTMRGESSKRSDKLLEIPRKKLNMRLYTEQEQKIQNLINSKTVTISIIALVGIYAILIFVIVALEELMDETQFNNVSVILSWIELGILIVFILEIAVGLYAWGVMKYYKDKWLILDTLIILLSLFFVIFELADQKTSNVVKVIQAVFRFLRIFLLIRKAQTFRRLSTMSTISTPAEKIVRFLSELKEVIELESMKLDIDYCIDKIGNNQLYQMGKLDDDNAEAMGWLNQSQQGKSSVRKIVTVEQQQQQKKVLANFQRLNIPKRVLELLDKQHDDLYIDPFECDKLSGGEGLVYLMLFLFENYNLYDVFLIKPKVVRSYFEEVMRGYQDNPYHNRVHAQDVAQTCNFLLNRCKFIEIGQLDEQDIACVLIAGAIHDYGHPGLTNAFLINSKNELALTYNDQSVLEMFHPSQCFKIAWTNQKANIFESLTFQKYRRIRESIISMVLSTDMAHHASELAITNSRVAAPDFEPYGKDKQRLMDLVVHSSDVSNPTKSFEIYKQWTERVLTEFWLQGDKERELGLPISYLCNRYTTNMAEAQLGFIDYVVKPTFSCVQGFLPAFEPYLENLDKNKAKWQELVGYYKQQLASIQTQ